ncbi:hypothetical protein HAX54_012864, partial [Datura stramonium]|nr:hypothetical protein [Datura stramonium]
MTNIEDVDPTSHVPTPTNVLKTFKRRNDTDKDECIAYLERQLKILRGEPSRDWEPTHPTMTALLCPLRFPPLESP